MLNSRKRALGKEKKPSVPKKVKHRTPTEAKMVPTTTTTTTKKKKKKNPVEPEGWTDEDLNRMVKVLVKKVDEKNVKNAVFLQKERRNEAYAPIDQQSKEEENRSSSPYQPGIGVTSTNGDEENSIIPRNHSAGAEEKQVSSPPPPTPTPPPPPPPPPPPNTADGADWVQIPCPDGKEGCEVLHLSKRSPPTLPLNPLPPPPPATTNEPIPPKDQSIHLHNNLILARGHAAAHHCYWSLVMDTLIIAMVQYCDEMCKRCKNNSLQKHDLCKDPVKTIWTHHRKTILPRVDYAALTAKMEHHCLHKLWYSTPRTRDTL